MRGTDLRGISALLGTIFLVAGCSASSVSMAPAGPTSPSPTTTSTETPAVIPSLAPTASPSASAATAAHWEAAGTMAIPRHATHAVLLGDGRVLVAGNMHWGEGADDSAKAEVWDPATGAWRATESLNKPRVDFVAVPLLDGRVLVTGGTNEANQSYSSTYLYDPRSGTWSKAGLLGTARSAPSAAVLPDGRVLVVGGYYRVEPTYGSGATGDSALAAYHPDLRPVSVSSMPRLADVEPPNIGAALATAELFDPATGQWSATGPMRYARFGAAAVTLADGRVLVVGCGPSMGVTVDDRAYDSAEIYDPGTGTFSLVGQLPAIDRAAVTKLGVALPDGEPAAADNGTLVALHDGGALLLAHGGWWKHSGEITRSFRFDVATGRWHELGAPYADSWNNSTGATSVTSGVRNLQGAVVARLPDGRVLVAGGGGMYQYAGEPSASAQLYDPTTDTWSALPLMPDTRTGSAAVVLTDGSVLFVGGVDETVDPTVVLASAIRFVPAR